MTPQCCELCGCGVEGVVRVFVAAAVACADEGDSEFGEVVAAGAKCAVRDVEVLLDFAGRCVAVVLLTDLGGDLARRGFQFGGVGCALGDEVRCVGVDKAAVVAAAGAE